MTRLLCFAGVVLAAVLAIAADEPNPRPVRTIRPPSPTAVRGFADLSLLTEQVQKELGLTPEQKEKLKDARRKALGTMRDEPKIDRAKLRDMAPEEREKVQQEIAKRNAERAEQVRKQIEEILTPQQAEQLKDIKFRQVAVGMLSSGQMPEQIELTDEQRQKLRKIQEEMRSKMTQLQRETVEQQPKLHKIQEEMQSKMMQLQREIEEQQQKLRKIQEEMQSKMMQLQRESQDKTLGVLTPEQTKKLKELTGNNSSGGERAGAAVAPKPRQKSN